MATCDRECETCQYGKTCPTSCRLENIIRRHDSGSDYVHLTDGVKTWIRYGHLPTANLRNVFAFRKRGYILGDDDNTKAGEIWDTIVDAKNEK